MVKPIVRLTGDGAELTALKCFVGPLVTWWSGLTITGSPVGLA